MEAQERQSPDWRIRPTQIGRLAFPGDINPYINLCANPASHASLPIQMIPPASHAENAPCSFHLRFSSLWPPAVKCCADRTLCAVTAQLGWSDPTNYFGHGNVYKSGVAPAQSGVLSAPELIVVPCAKSSDSDSSENPKVNGRVTDRVICVYHAPVTLRRCFRQVETRRQAPICRPACESEGI